MQGPRRRAKILAVDQTDDGRPDLERGDLAISATMTHNAATINLNELKRDGAHCAYDRPGESVRGRPSTSSRGWLDSTRPRAILCGPKHAV